MIAAPLPSSTTSAPASAPGPVLRDIHLPSDPSWWPPAPGWWLLAGLLLLVVFCCVWIWRRHRSQSEKHARVLAELDRLQVRYQRDGSASAFASGMHQLLRRVARRHDARAAQQQGDAWRQTLARVPVDSATLDRLMLLEQAIYRSAHDFDHVAASGAVRHWLQLALKPSKWKRVDTSAAAKGAIA